MRLKPVLVLSLMVLAAIFVGAQSDSGSEVDVEVEDECDVGLFDFTVPGNDTNHQIIRLDGDPLTGTLGNTGNQVADADLNVTIFNSTDDPIDMGLQNLTSDDYYSNYTLDTYTNETDDHQRFQDFIYSFQAVYQPGNYTARAEVNYTCTSTGQEGEFNETGEFEIIEVEDVDSGGDVPLGDKDENEDGKGGGGSSDGDNNDDVRTVPDGLTDQLGSLPFEINNTQFNQLEFDEDFGLDFQRDLIDNLAFSSEGFNELDYSKSLADKLDMSQSDLERLGAGDTSIDELDVTDSDLEKLAGEGMLQVELSKNQGDLQAKLSEMTEDGEFSVGEAENAEPQEGNEGFPGDVPLPWVGVSIEPLNNTYTAERGSFNEIDLRINNTGDESIEEVNVETRLGDDWDSRNAEIGEIDVDGSVERSVYIQPSEDVEPGMYQIPVYAWKEFEGFGERDIGQEFVTVEVKEGRDSGAVAIQEAPRDLRIEKESSQSLPILVENPGEQPVTNVSAKLEGHEECGEIDSDVIERVEAGESESLNIEFKSGANVEECASNLVVSSSEGHLAFSDINFEVRDEVSVVPDEFKVPIIASIWTVLLVFYAFATKRFNMDDSMAVKLPLVFLVVGQTVIVIYLASSYYGMVPAGFLPF